MVQQIPAALPSPPPPPLPVQKDVYDFIVKEGTVRSGGAARKGGFLGIIASNGVPVAIGLAPQAFFWQRDAGFPKASERQRQRNAGSAVAPTSFLWNVAK